MKTFLDFLGIQYPIIQAGMVWTSGWKLAANVSNAGALGTIGAGSMRPDLLRTHIVKLKESTKNPFAVNVPLLYKHSNEIINVIIEQKVPIVITSAGNPKIFIEHLKAHNIKTLHVISNLTQAKKCEVAGVDAIICEGTEAGGHNGIEELTTMVLTPLIVDNVSIPVISAGGICDGRSMAAAMCLGASAVQIGTRFAMTKESSLHKNYKQLLLTLTDNSTRLLMKKSVPVRLILNKFANEIIDLETKGANREELESHLGIGRARMGMFEGDLDDGELEIGQVAARIKDLLSAGDVVKSIMTEFQKTVSSFVF